MNESVTLFFCLLPSLASQQSQSLTVESDAEEATSIFESST